MSMLSEQSHLEMPCSSRHAHACARFPPSAAPSVTVCEKNHKSAGKSRAAAGSRDFAGTFPELVAQTSRALSSLCRPVRDSLRTHIVRDTTRHTHNCHICTTHTNDPMLAHWKVLVIIEEKDRRKRDRKGQEQEQECIDKTMHGKQARCTAYLNGLVVPCFHGRLDLDKLFIGATDAPDICATNNSLDLKVSGGRFHVGLQKLDLNRGER